MHEAFSFLLRYALVSVGTYFVSTGDIDQSLVEPLVGTGMAMFGFGWAVYLWKTNRIKDTEVKED